MLCSLGVAAGGKMNYKVAGKKIDKKERKKGGKQDKKRGKTP